MSYDFKNLSDQNYCDIFNNIIDGKINDEQIKNFLLGLNNHGFTSEAFSGAIKSFKPRCKQIISPTNAIDVCGTGGDKLNTLNISTAVAFVVAGSGIPVAKHGNRAISSNSGSADVLAELGVNIQAETKEAEQSLIENKICFIFAPLYHQAFKNISEIRSKLAKPTIFNFLGPLLNPSSTKYQLIGTSKKETILPMIKAMRSQESDKVFIVHGLDGMDEATICSNFLLTKLEDNKITAPEIINPEDFGIKKVSLEAIKGGDAKYNASKIIDLLNGEKSPYSDIVTLNAALALMVANQVNNIFDGIKKAEKVIESGEAKKVLQKLQRNTASHL